jgi:hypothetical protein
MRRCVQLMFASWFAISMTMAQAWISAAQTSTYSRSEPNETGAYSAGSSDSHFDASGYTSEQRESQALTEYLKQRKLPLVGAQVLRRTDGGHMVVLYGFVGSDFGKADAANKTHRFLHDSGVVVDNRINVKPELLASNRPALGSANGAYPGYPPAAGSNSDTKGSSSPDTSAYPGPESYKAQQSSPYSQQLTSMMPLIALLGVLGMGVAGGGSGLSFGSGSSFGSSPFGSPYSSPYGAPYASPYGPNASPYGSSPFGGSPYGRSPYGTSPYGSAPYPYP